MQEFASIGKGILLQSLGLQGNYKEEVDAVLDLEKSGCYECPYYYNQNSDACASCSKKCYVTKTVYHNERNMYGYRPMLKANAIKLLLYVHFCHPDANGIVKNVHASLAARELGCDIKTIYNNLEILAYYGYICYARIGSGVFNIFICDYKKYFLSAKEGGRGYIVMNQPLVKALFLQKNINAIRIYLREVIDIDNENTRGGTFFNTIEKTYTDMRRSLPSYCKRGVIVRSLTENTCEFFKVEYKPHTVRFSIDDNFNGKKCKAQKLDEYISLLNDFIKDFNQQVVLDSSELSSNASDGKLHISVAPATFSFTESEISNIAHLAIEFTYEDILDALKEIYDSYLVPGNKIGSIGALIRTVVIYKYQMQSIA